ncbi:unnamed protein product [Angiostrongylus costaricensis]|uniref:Uncharacterized protein n=1 Tax=Angiostrongylus costaricensis TaxID=334426 RepID=A0A0R3PY93_ANGCS|nr:unnamed protein product [Angiostrongylus costaricensis]
MANGRNNKKKVIPSVHRPPPTSTTENNFPATKFYRRKLRHRNKRVLIIVPPKDAILEIKRSVENFGVPIREVGPLPGENDLFSIVEDAYGLAKQELRMNVSVIASDIFKQCAKEGKKR